MKFDKSKLLQPKSHALIPGGAHTYAKGDDQYPELSPGFIARGKGCHVWDVDGNEFIEYGMGLRAVTLGHAYDSVVEAATKAMQLGINFTRPTPLETETAEMFLNMIDQMDMVKFSKNGSDADDAALRLARAYTGRDYVAVCVDHPFFSVSDWFIGTTIMNAGIPQATQDLILTFHYNDLPELQMLFDTHPNQIACVIMEVETATSPEPGYLQAVREMCTKQGALLIFDEIITGFRWHNKGAQYMHQIVPDLCTFGKAMGNGYSIAALAGKREFMERGGLKHDKERVFLLSYTFGAESHSLAAAMAVMKVYQEEDVVGHLWRQGDRLIKGITEVIAEHGLQDYVGLHGKPCNLVFYNLDREGNRSQAYRSMFLQEMVKRGVIGPSLVISYSHTDEDIDRTIEAFGGALGVYKQALEDGVEKYLVGRPSNVVFRKYN
ncbi:MAG: glutamate-1-semialdehyde 2,1-aminomutase [Anaerolineales bacterium]|nr:glutamate-1-semialdehyde 2,1-aminomutase [Anaerolineales bacterium]